MTFNQAVDTLQARQPYGDKKVMSPAQVLELLQDDVVQMVERPGSWEGSNMAVVFQGHGISVEI